MLNFCANNYLGLSDNQRLINAAKEAMDTHGFGMSSVRFICGTQDLHKQLEAAISDYFKTEDTILYAACFRFSEESDHLYIIAKSFYFGKEDGIVHMEQLSFIVGSHYLITIQETDTDYFKDVKKRLYDGKTRIRSFGTC